MIERRDYVSLQKKNGICRFAPDKASECSKYIWHNNAPQLLQLGGNWKYRIIYYIYVVI